MAKDGKFPYGLACCVLAQVSYGMNGFGAHRLRDLGFESHSILFYRFAIASLVLLAILAARREPWRTPPRDALTGALGGLCFGISSLALYLSFTLMDSGLACTLLFVYPVMIIAIMAAFFRERPSRPTIFSAAAAFAGIAVLSGPGGAATRAGVLCAMLSALAYAAYMILYERRRPKMGAFKMALFSTFFCALTIVAHAAVSGHPIQAIRSPDAFGYVVFLALVPTVVSVYFTVESLRCLGPTLTGIFGALEPLTAVVMGALVLGEAFTPRLGLGAGLVLSAATYLAAAPRRAPPGRRSGSPP